MTHVLKLETGEHDREQCPVCVVLQGQGTEAAGSVRLVRRGDGKEIPCQWRQTEKGLVLEWILEKAFRAETIVYEAKVTQATPARRPDERQGVILRQAEDRIDVLLGGVPFCSYHYGARTLKPYLGPVLGPYGRSYTRLDPQTTEHPHHRSVWVGHGDVNGVDFWGEPTEGKQGVHGRIAHKRIDAMESGPVCGRMSVTNTWTALSGRDILEEARTMQAYATADHLRLFDIRIELRSPYGEVRLGATKEAGPFALRVAEGMKVTNGGSFVNGCGGVEERECWSKRAPWCDYFGLEDGHMLGIAIFDNPSNDGYPTTWHVRNYGLMSPNRSLMGEKIVKAGDSLSFEYRVIFHAGNVRQAGIADRFNDYINPPRVNIE